MIMKKIRKILKKSTVAALTAVLITTSVPAGVLAEEVTEETAAVDEDTAGSEDDPESDVEDAFPFEGKGNHEAVDEESSAPSEESGGEGVTTDKATDEKSEKKVSVDEVSENKAPSFEESKTIGDVTVTVSSEVGVLPEDAVLSVKRANTIKKKQAEEAVESVREDDMNVAASYTYDIKILDKDGEEVQPEDESKVHVSFTLDEVADENLTTNIYHITESDEVDEGNEGNVTDQDLTAEKLPVDTDGNTATAETDGFSLYTVEFTYKDLRYVMPGDTTIALSEILGTIGLTGDVTDVKVSDDTLFSAEKNDKDEWLITANKAFSSNEWLKVTINGVVYEITVTDDNITAVNYIDADGVTQTCTEYTVLSENGIAALNDKYGADVNAKELPDGWYVVPANTTVSYEGMLNLSGHIVNLILCDGATLSLENEDNCIFGFVNDDDDTSTLNIYGQSGGTGKLIANNKKNITTIQVVNLTVNGGELIVTQTGDSSVDAIRSKVVMNGGKLTAESKNYYAIQPLDPDADNVTFKGGTFIAKTTGSGAENKGIAGKISLDYTDASDTFFATRWGYDKMTIADGKAFTEGYNVYTGINNNGKGETLYPAVRVKTESPNDGGMVTEGGNVWKLSDLTSGTKAIVRVWKNQKGWLPSITVTKAGGGTISQNLITRTGPDTDDGKTYTFEFPMPRENVTVTATFTRAPITGDCSATAKDHVTYTLTDTDGDEKYDKLVISGTGAMADYASINNTAPWLGEYRYTIKNLEIREGVTHIGNYAFDTCREITPSVTIPASVESIGESAFYDCEGLTGITLPAKLKSIGANAFDHCNKLANVTFEAGSGLKDIGDCAFQNCGNLTGINLPADLESIGEGAFRYCKGPTALTIPAKVTTIGNEAFRSCSGLEDLTIPAKVAAIGDRAFNGCTSLAVVKILGKPDTIGDKAFFTGKPNTMVYAPAVNATEALTNACYDNNQYPAGITYICTAPTAPTTTLTYNGTEQTYPIAAPANCGYTVSGNKQINAGNYTAKAVLTATKTKTANGNKKSLSYSWGDVDDPATWTTADTADKEYSWSIAPKSISGVTIEAIPDETYRGSAVEPTVTVKDGTKTLVKDTDYTVACSNNTNAAKKTSSNAPTVTVTGKGNYSSTTTAAAKFTIVPKSITISGITATDKKYDGKTNAVLDYSNVSYTGKLDSDSLSVTATGTFDNANAGENKTVNISGLTLGGESAGNYKLAESGQQATMKANITTRPITVTAKDQSVELEKNIATGTDQVELSGDGLASGQTLGSVTLESSSTAAITTSGTITPSAAVIKSGTTDVTANYNITYVEGKLTVTKIKAKVTTAPKAVTGLVYTGQDQTLIEEGTAEGGTLKYSLTSGSDYAETVPKGKNAVTYTVYYKVFGDANHEDSDEGSLTVTIKRAKATVTPDEKEKNTGEQDPALTAKVTGLINNESTGLINYVLSRAAGEDAGIYEITASGDAVQGNYEVTYKKNNFYIYKKAEETLSSNTVPVGNGQIETKVVSYETGENEGFKVEAVEIPAALAEGLMTTQEMTAVEGGATLTVTLEIKEKSSTNTSAEDEAAKAKAEEAVKNDTGLDVNGTGMMLDIKLYKQIEGGQKSPVEPAQGTGKISFTIEVPVSMRNTDDKVIRTFFLVHLYDNGKVEIASSGRDTTLPVETESLSSWYLTYTDQNTDTGSTGDGEKKITVSDNKPMDYRVEKKGSYSFSYYHEIPFWGKTKSDIKLFGDKGITVSVNNATYKVTKVKINKKKNRIQILKLAGADKKTEKDVKKATKGSNGLTYKVNPYYVRNTDSLSIKTKKDGTPKSVKIMLGGKYYKAKKSEWGYSSSQKTITFKGSNLAGSYKK